MRGRFVRHVEKLRIGEQCVRTYNWDTDDRHTAVTTPADDVWRYTYDPLVRHLDKRRLDAEGDIMERVAFAWDGAQLGEQTHTIIGSTRVTMWDYQLDTVTPVAQIQHTPRLRDTPQQVIDAQFHAIVTELTGSPAELVTSDGTILIRQRRRVPAEIPRPVP